MEEFDCVELVNDFVSKLDKNVVIPAGTSGVIVFVHEGEKDFEVELFDQKTKSTISVETINTSNLRLTHKFKK